MTDFDEGNRQQRFSNETFRSSC